MSQNEEEQRSALTCPNNSCAKTFVKHLRALNLQSTSAGPYDACPYCLTEIKLDELVAVNDGLRAIEIGEKAPLQNPAQTAQKSSGCNYHLGYLSERESKDEIPDGCIICKDIVECMLKKMKG